MEICHFYVEDIKEVNFEVIQYFKVMHDCP